MDKRSELLGLINVDPLGLLQIPEDRQSSNHSENSVLRNKFEDIVSYYEDHGKEPESNLHDIYEYQLYCRLKVMRSSPEMVKYLKPFDLHGLLNACRELTLEQVISEDPLGLLSDTTDDQDIFTLRNVKQSERINPEFISRRKKCLDFELYKPLFENILEELENGRRKLAQYKSSELKENGFYVLNGVIVYLSKVDGSIDNYAFESGSRERFDGRTECIFDNGTCSDMLFRSLDKALQKDGYCISEIISSEKNQVQITKEDLSFGYIYVLKSLHPRLRGEKDVFKIGCTTTSVSERIKNARNEATYLFADVEIVETYKCYNISAHDVEQVVHSFLDNVRLDIDIPDTNGNIAKPREWFHVKLEIVDEIVELLQHNTLNNYVFDKRTGRIVQR